MRHWTLITVVGMQTVVYVALESVRAMKPGASANERAARKPFRAVIAVRRTRIWSIVIIAVGACRSGANVDADTDLSLCFRKRHRETDCSKRNESNKLEFVHK